MTASKKTTVATALIMLLAIAACGTEPETGEVRVITGDELDAWVEDVGTGFNVEDGDAGMWEIPLDEPVTKPPSTSIETADSSTSPSTVPVIVEKPCRAFLLGGPTFDSNTADLNDRGASVVSKFVSNLKEEPALDGCSCSSGNIELSFDGHTDDVPTNRPGGNQQLSLDRAQATADFFAANGLRVKSVTGHGDNAPLYVEGVDNRTVAEIRADNRRVEIYIWCGA